MNGGMNAVKKLDARLQAIADLVQGEIIADVGSDHAYLPAWLAKHNKIKKAYALDISPNCVGRIKANLGKFNIPQEIISPVLSDGLAGLGDCAIAGLTDVIIAGMGGETIARILSGIKKRAGINFILQPNTKKELLKDYLLANNFEVSQEIKVQDKKRYYIIMRASCV